MLQLELIGGNTLHLRSYFEHNTDIVVVNNNRSLTLPKNLSKVGEYTYQLRFGMSLLKEDNGVNFTVFLDLKYEKPRFPFTITVTGK